MGLSLVVMNVQKELFIVRLPYLTCTALGACHAGIAASRGQ